MSQNLPLKFSDKIKDKKVLPSRDYYEDLKRRKLENQHDINTKFQNLAFELTQFICKKLSIILLTIWILAICFGKLELKDSIESLFFNFVFLFLGTLLGKLM